MRSPALVLALAAAAGAAAPAGAQGVTAILEPAQHAELRPAVPGRIEAILVAEGDRVMEGEVLARMDDAVQEARVAVARASASAEGARRRAELAEAEAEAVLARVEAAARRGAAQPWEAERARHALATARAEFEMAGDQLARAEAELRLEEATLERFALRAPFDATVLRVLREPGEAVGAGETIVEVGRLDALEATAFVPAAWLDALAPGDAVAGRLSDGTPASLAVRWIDPRVDAASGTARATLELPEPGAGARPGLAVTLEAP